MPRPRLSPAVVALVALLMVPVIYSIFSVGVSLAYIALPVLVFGTLAWFMWRMWGRTLWRANRIKHIRERRLLDEAARR